MGGLSPHPYITNIKGGNNMFKIIMDILKDMASTNRTYGMETKRSFENATMTQINRYLRENGMQEYIGYSREYIVSRMVSKAKNNLREYKVF